jgi:SAM-dependent methyltransferase
MTNCELEAAGNQSMTLVCEAIMASRGGIPSEARILDFGCGQGRHVREFRAASYDVVGVDRFHEELDVPRSPLHDGQEYLYSSDAQGRFPFASDSFDFCYSTSVFEHVMDYDQAVSGIWRVLRPGAWTLHIFPARWRPVEPHIFTPFGGRFQHPAVISLWAHLGIRNSFQKGLGAEQTAARNLTYSRTGINYPPKREIVRSFGRYFGHVEFIEREFVSAIREVSRLSGLLAPVISWPGVEALYRDFHTRVVLARKSCSVTSGSAARTSAPMRTSNSATRMEGDSSHPRTCPCVVRSGKEVDSGRPTTATTAWPGTLCVRRAPAPGAHRGHRERHRR